MRDATTIMKSAEKCLEEEKLCARACFDDTYTDRGAIHPRKLKE